MNIAIIVYVIGCVLEFDALFETESGFTTTGASILNDVEALSHASLFWRSFTHWVGGMGIFMLILTILPLAGAHGMNRKPGSVCGEGASQN